MWLIFSARLVVGLLNPHLFSRLKPGLQYDADDARDARGDAREDAQAGVIL